jgi:hypothetical protein
MSAVKILKATLEIMIIAIKLRNKLLMMVLINLETKRFVNIQRILIIAFQIISLLTKINSIMIVYKEKMVKYKNKLQILCKLSNHPCKIKQMICKF